MTFLSVLAAETVNRGTRNALAITMKTQIGLTAYDLLDLPSHRECSMNETYYLVYAEWPEGPGGKYRLERLKDAIEEARMTAKKWSGQGCEVKLLKVTKKFIDFSCVKP